MIYANFVLSLSDSLAARVAVGCACVDGEELKTRRDTSVAEKLSTREDASH